MPKVVASSSRTSSPSQQGDPARVEVRDRRGSTGAGRPRASRRRTVSVLAGEGRDRGLARWRRPRRRRRAPPPRTTASDVAGPRLRDHGGHGDHGHLVVDLGGEHLQPVGDQVHRPGLEQPHVPVDAAAGVPARVLVARWPRPSARSRPAGAGGRRARRSGSSRRGGGRPSSRSPTRWRRGRRPRTRRPSWRPRRPPGPRSCGGTPRHRPGSSRWPARPSRGALRADDGVVRKGDRLPRGPHPDQLEVAVLLGPELPALVQGGATHGKTLAHRGC